MSGMLLHLLLYLLSLLRVKIARTTRVLVGCHGYAARIKSINKMPLDRRREPLWKQWDLLAQKDGKRETLYTVCGDEYTGEWKDNLKHGMLNQMSIEGSVSRSRQPS